jgi:AraC-like DNA-binding protein
MVAWEPLAVATMRHVLDQVYGRVDLPDTAVAQIAQHFLAPVESELRFAAERRLLGGTALITMTHSALRVVGAETPASRELVHIAFVLRGTVTITPKAGDAVALGPGASCAVGDWSAFDLECTDSVRGFHIVLQSSRLADRGVHVRPSRFTVDSGRSLRAPLRGFALSVADASWSASTVGELVAERTIEDLVVGMFLEADGHSMDGEDLRAGLRARALVEIAANHRDPRLTPAVVAARLSVSLRHLQRAFEHAEQSVAHAIASRRAESAALLLVSPMASGHTMQQIAQHCGFSSAFELRAAFRDHYAMLPSEFRTDASTPALALERG